MLTIEQFKSQELNEKFKEMFIEKTLSYQSSVFKQLIADGKVKDANPDIMAIHFYSPIFMFLFRYDKDDSRIDDGLNLVKKHIKEFFTLYLKGELIWKDE